jgi:GPH family glycoside/pentoside/hexuronide:cation symporter
MDKPMPKLIRYTYGVGDVMTSLLSVVRNMFWTFCLTNVMLFPIEQVVMITGIGTTLQLVTSFFIGPILSGTPEMPWGRYRSFMLVGAPITQFFFVLMFTKIGSGYAAAIIMVTVYTINSVIHSLVLNAHGSLVNIIGRDDVERGMLASNRGVGTAAAGILASYTTTPLAALLAVRLGAQLGYTLMTVIISVVYIAAFWYTAWMVKDYEKAGTGSAKEKSISLVDMLKSTLKNPPLITVFVADVCRFIGNLVFQASVAYYFTYIIFNMGLMPQYILFGSILQVLGAFISGRLTSKFSSKMLAVVGELGVGGCLILINFFGYSSAFGFTALMVLRLMHGFAYSMYFACYADCVLYGEWKTGQFMPGFVNGISGIAVSVGMMVAGWLTPILLMSSGFISGMAAEEVTPQVQAGILNLVAFIPGIARACSRLILLFFYRLTREKLITYASEIKERKAKGSVG